MADVAERRATLTQAAEALSSFAASGSNGKNDGKWLETATLEAAPFISDWNLTDCWWWEEWPDRDEVMPEGTPDTDVGIDLVGRRSDDGGWIAIQVKSRQLDEHGEGAAVNAGEMDKFLAASANEKIWAERWLAVNGAVSLGGHAPGKANMAGGPPVKVVNVAQSVESQLAALNTVEIDEFCPHCAASADDPSDEDEEISTPIQTRSCMQREAVADAVKGLRENETTDEEGIPRGEARGKIVLPCGAGKTRVALRIVEELTYSSELSVVLCPSIALVAQIRREFLQHAAVPLRTMAVCSDQGVAPKDEEKVTNDDDGTLDRGLTSTEVIRGSLVTTDPAEIAQWIRQRRDEGHSNAVSVIFGTYQSARKVSEGIAQAEAADAFKVLVCDEAHRTAGVRRKKRSSGAEERLREFTLCHDRDAFPATYRIYQTATPRIFSDTAMAAISGRSDRNDFVIREMNDEATFGVDLYRRSYADAVTNGWLSDYRIIAMGVGGQEATDIANELVREADKEAIREAEQLALTTVDGKRKPSSAGRRVSRLPTTGDYLKGMAFALAMGGGARTPSGERVPLRSCIGFLNTIARSKAMTAVLQSESVREWVAKQAGDPAVDYRLEHLDASAPVAKRDEAKRKLASGSAKEPHSVMNVGIFGEGTDSPSLSAVAFLEPRKSPIDVVQAVGRAMRKADGKQLGYIIAPIVIPPGVDAERHLATSGKHEGWKELGEILQALRAHDKRIEDALPEMLQIQVPPEPLMEVSVKTAVAAGRPDKTKLEYAVVTGSRDAAEDTVRSAVKENRPLLEYENTEPLDESLWNEPEDCPSSLIVHIERPDRSTRTCEDAVVHRPPEKNQEIGIVNERQTKKRATKVANGQRGRVLPEPAERNRLRAEREAERQAIFEGHVQGVLIDLEDKLGGDIVMNLLEKSGLTGNKVQRDLNLLADAVGEAARHIHDEEGLAAELDAHFDLDQLSAPKAGKPRADGATIAALLWMNAAMLHQRIHAGGWLGRKPIVPLSEIRRSSTPEAGFIKSWNAITRQDFRPVIDPAVEALEAAKDSDRLGGLGRALRHLASEAEQIAETYADMGTDHAGALFNKVMGDQSSDGAFFTRPIAADIAARLALDAVDPDNKLDWSNPDVWRDHKTVDLACGSGTLLAAVMSEMKRRAATHGADSDNLAELQKVAVEEVMKGLDINPVSLQLAATQLMSGNTDVKYRKMGLHLMPYGPQADRSVAAGTPELFGRQEIVAGGRLFDDAANSKTVKTGAEVDAIEGPEMDDAAAAAKDAGIVIMNPPFTARPKMGEKFDRDTQLALRKRMDTLEGYLAAENSRLSEFLDKNSLGPRFAALASLCARHGNGVVATIKPTAAMTNSSGLPERIELARQFHIHTIFTCHNPNDINLSQDTSVNESIVVMRRCEEPRPPTRVITLDRMPTDDEDTQALFKALAETSEGSIGDGWGEMSWWSAERIAAGDWTAGQAFRSPDLDDAAAKFAEMPELSPLANPDVAGGGAGSRRIRKTGPEFSGAYRRRNATSPTGIAR